MDAPIDASTPAQTVRAFMDAYDLTSADLGAIAGVSPRAVQLWLTGLRRPPQSLLLIIQACRDGRLDMTWLARVT